ncbi:4-hydroxy-tetrahydrodipicolinate synthase [Xanthobacter dioxanivorans]|uniref:4-hydroxy-tetrahydrodipicolinate synthase n=2 Tax=Xanthobacter dioxanivorans TaxID=2528964 RepID=A0A974PL97_9HYPH|nr:4-hydroxy-tetrahydrodipicolinate synthase [Xanthobacter dioxanivorans]
MTSFRGSFTVMVTPFTADGRLDAEGLARFVDWQVREGVHGLIPLGSTGEFLSLTRAERRRVGEIVVEAAAGRVPVLIGTAAEWTNEAVELTREAESIGADGVMIIPPFYSSPTTDEIYAHYRTIAAAIHIPIMIYNNPFTSNVDLPARLVARLSEIDNVSYIKESSGSVPRTAEIIRLCGDRMTVFSGYHPWESYRVGAAGYVSVFSNIAPALSAELYTRTVVENDFAGGRAIADRVAPLLDALAGDLYVSATKAALGMIGQPGGPPRAPRLPLPEDRSAPLKAVLESLCLV